jgi:AAA+ superfamily predicted ATPase
MGDITQLLKFQMISQLGLNANRQEDPSGYSLWTNIALISVVSIADDIGKCIPVLAREAKRVVLERLRNRMEKQIPIMKRSLFNEGIPLHLRHDQNSIKMTRLYDKQCEANAIVDSILAVIARLNNVPMFDLIGNGALMVTYKERPIQVAKDIFVLVEQLCSSNENEVVSITLRLLSNSLSAAELSAFVQATHNKYLEDTRNSLCGKLYFFDQKYRPCDTSKATKKMMISTAPKQLSFTMSEFYSNKTFDNVFGQRVREIENRIDFFCENKDWYDRKGIPYQLGLLLSGVPGSGKTSVIRAAANKTRRHIVNVNFSNIRTASQLKQLFHSDRLQVYNDATCATQKSLYIPVSERLYILEEVDTLGAIVAQRSGKQAREDYVEDELTLGDILTVLDGTMEIPGRMIIMTTNHPEVLDKALIRPGRIDVHAHFGNADREIIAEMYYAYIERPFPRERIHELPDQVLSPAEVSQVLFTYVHSPDNVDAIIRSMQSYKTPPASESTTTFHEPLPHPKKNENRDTYVENEGLSETNDYAPSLEATGCANPKESVEYGNGTGREKLRGGNGNVKEDGGEPYVKVSPKLSNEEEIPHYWDQYKLDSLQKCEDKEREEEIKNGAAPLEHDQNAKCSFGLVFG